MPYLVIILLILSSCTNGFFFYPSPKQKTPNTSRADNPGKTHSERDYWDMYGKVR